MERLKGKVAVVIGGHSGFGGAISRLFAAEGAVVVIAARRLALSEEVAGEIGATAAMCDITDDAQVHALADKILADHGRLDIAVNCAGYQESTPLADLTAEKLEAMHSVQLTGAMYCMRHFGNAMAASPDGGAFLSLSSLTAQNPARGLIAYASAKAALEYATKIAAVEYGAQQVRFNAIAPSLIETPMTAPMFQPNPAIQAILEMTPLGHHGTSQDVANAALFLCGPEGRFVTGQTIKVDGGSSLQMLPNAQIYADVAARWKPPTEA